jgi:16S rRNA (cytosine967-C5)-methyltransferase
VRYIRQHIGNILEAYKGDVPLSHFLKNYFKKYPILGSRDRKILSAMAYNWYRCVRGVNNDELLLSSMEQWFHETKLLTTPLPELLADASVLLDLDALFPYDVTLSTGIDKAEWLQSMLLQPDLFIRIRRDMEKITDLLRSHQVPFKFITDTCLSLPNGAKIDQLLPAESYVVQDASSQQTGAYFAAQKGEYWYDCCAGAGGKSLLLTDLEPGVRLTVSDKRESIIHNLQKRFRQYHHTVPASFVADVTNGQQLDKALGSRLFDNIICDAPCSGSGTWSRTPEQLYFFDPGTLPAFTSLQKRIAGNVVNYLKPGGRLFYITCSVFREENEEVISAIAGQTGLQLVGSHLINGAAIRADSMFIAIMRKPSL